VAAEGGAAQQARRYAPAPSLCLLAPGHHVVEFCLLLLVAVSILAATIPDRLTQGVPLEDVQYRAGHADPRTNRLYDWRQKQGTRHMVERISV
jgi:hypothetical protein